MTDYIDIIADKVGQFILGFGGYIMKLAGSRFELWMQLEVSNIEKLEELL